MSGWVNGNLYIPTSEVLGIIPIPPYIQQASGMAEFSPTLDRKQQHGFLAELQRTRKPVLPIHTPSERHLFCMLMETNHEFNAKSSPIWRNATKVWNHHADTMIMFHTRFESFSCSSRDLVNVGSSSVSTSRRTMRAGGPKSTLKSHFRSHMMFANHSYHPQRSRSLYHSTTSPSTAHASPCRWPGPSNTSSNTTQLWYPRFGVEESTSRAVKHATNYSDNGGAIGLSTCLRDHRKCMQSFKETM